MSETLKEVVTINLNYIKRTFNPQIMKLMLLLIAHGVIIATEIILLVLLLYLAMRPL